MFSAHSVLWVLSVISVISALSAVSVPTELSLRKEKMHVIVQITISIVSSVVQSNTRSVHRTTNSSLLIYTKSGAPWPGCPKLALKLIQDKREF